MASTVRDALLLIACALVSCGCSLQQGLVKTGAIPQEVLNGFRFTEGVCTDGKGNIFFSDLQQERIYRWTADGRLLIFKEQSRKANGLAVDRDGRLIACLSCPGGGLVAYGPDGSETVLAETYQGKRFNSLNDLWIDAKGGIYLTDPRYGSRAQMEQDGEHVYYLTPDRKKVIRVIDDLVRPNGLTGSPDVSKLYVADHGGGKTYVYDIRPDGTLTNKRLFAPTGSDGMTLDRKGNVYLTTRSAVEVYDPKGNKLAVIGVPQTPSNVCFGGPDGRTLYITAGTGLYSIRMAVKGLWSN
ncbi:MAG: SMP-30/gluconolactonase/LRE family protein [Sedimentisphaerales bacterium]|nr:SMP-30/gluconolactonase/LRE family protein [Sedimentisphaerales bacterium]